MSSQYYRLKKGQSLMLSLYSVSIVSLLSYMVLLGLIAWTLAVQLDFLAFKWSFIYLIAQTFQYIGVSMLASAFIALSICCYFLVYKNSEWCRYLKIILFQLNEVPLLLYGVLPLFLFNHSDLSFYFIYIMVIVPRLTFRWLKLSGKVKDVELESVRALGFNSLQILKTLYYDQFIKIYVFHIGSLFCLMFFLISPFIWFQNLLNKPLSLHVFTQFGQDDRSMPILLALLLCVFSLKLWIDYQIKSYEVDNV